ncbi:Glycosyltransferase [Rhodospirillaceae bacterium LM-1]|nr:Glycosyltransferase [Rhodospirillaceae bacterium LM-1]
MLSVVTPAFNEAENLPILYSRLSTVLSECDAEWEWIIVDDHSRDTTFQVITDMAVKDNRVKGLRLSRNFGSHAALLCGMEKAKGNGVICMSGDGQDPPEIILRLVEKWRNGVQVVWAAREARADATQDNIMSSLYWLMMRNMSGMEDTPAKGADFFLIDEVVVSALKGLQERNMSVLALITWMGFRQDRIFYARQKRLGGTSGWTLSKKIKLVIDSIIGFSYLPMRAMALIGALTVTSGLLCALLAVSFAIAGHPIEGVGLLLMVVLVLGGIQMLMISVQGEYLWRTLEESRRRPRYLIETATQNAQAPPSLGEPTRTHKT